MRGFLIPFANSLLIASLVLAASASGYFRTAHQISAAGQVTVVICGQDGPGAVTLDRDGAPIDPTGNQCSHCADCSLVSAFVLPAGDEPARGTLRARSAERVAAGRITPARLAGNWPRGPPLQDQVLI